MHVPRTAAQASLCLRRLESELPAVERGAAAAAAGGRGWGAEAGALLQQVSACVMCARWV